MVGACADLRATSRNDDACIRPAWAGFSISGDTMEGFQSKDVAFGLNGTGSPPAPPTTREREQVLRAFNNTAAPYPHNCPIHELFEAQVARAPDAIAVVSGDRLLTYAQLNQRANQLGWHLRDEGIRIGECIPVHMTRSAEMLIAQLALLKNGATYVPIDPAFPQERKAFIARDCGARWMLVDKPVASGVDPRHVRYIDCGGLSEASAGYAVENLAVPMESPPPAYVMYTSGSTGAPKGVVIPHRAVNRLVINNGYAKVGPADCVAHCSNPAFDSSTFEVWAALLNGARILILPQSIVLDSESFAAALERHGVTVLFLTTALFNQHATALPSMFTSLKYVLFGGETADPHVVRRVLGGGAPRHLLNVYGPTETTTFATSWPIDSVGHEMSRLPIGRPISNTQIYILDPEREVVSIGVTGEIHIGGAGVACGYLNRPELTAERFIPDTFSAEPRARMYKTGDLGRWHADGNIEFLGRNDSQVKIRGFRVEPGEIEAAIQSYPGVAQAIVIAREDEPGEKRLVGYVVADLPGLKAACHESADARGAEIVDQWKSVYEEMYSAGELGPSFVGWNSSYTGQPISTEHMREWLQHTLTSIRALKPRRVLEIGCGVGLLVEHLAPACAIYRGTDFSGEALRRLRGWLDTRKELRHVQIEQSSALQFDRAQRGGYDTVLLNSVVQYFPDIEYLKAVLERAVSCVVPGGRIFVGDVRELSLLNVFHGSIQLERAAPAVSMRELRSRIIRSRERERDLVIAALFFEDLPRRLEGISGA
ncbi:MAG: amino acid adenylation domain-containing protein, partial [Gammaproteobacteria bacterium]